MRNRKGLKINTSLKLTQLTTLPLKQGKCAESSIISSLTTLKYYQNIIHIKTALKYIKTCLTFTYD